MFCQAAPARRAAITAASWPAGTRSWRKVSRSRTVTVPSAVLCPSMVMPNGVPISS